LLLQVRRPLAIATNDPICVSRRIAHDADELDTPGNRLARAFLETLPASFERQAVEEGTLRLERFDGGRWRAAVRRTDLNGLGYAGVGMILDELSHDHPASAMADQDDLLVARLLQSAHAVGQPTRSNNGVDRGILAVAIGEHLAVARQRADQQASR